MCPHICGVCARSFSQLSIGNIFANSTSPATSPALPESAPPVPQAPQRSGGSSSKLQFSSSKMPPNTKLPPNSSGTIEARANAESMSMLSSSSATQASGRHHTASNRSVALELAHTEALRGKEKEKEKEKEAAGVPGPAKFN